MSDIACEPPESSDLQVSMPDLEPRDARSSAVEVARPADRASKRKRGARLLAAAGLIAGSLLKPQESAVRLLSAVSAIALVQFSK